MINITPTCYGTRVLKCWNIRFWHRFVWSFLQPFQSSKQPTFSGQKWE